MLMCKKAKCVLGGCDRPLRLIKLVKDSYVFDGI